MSTNPSQKARESVRSIEQNLNLVQPRLATTQVEKERIKEKIKVRAATRKAMAVQQLQSGRKSNGKGREGRESRLIPAEGGGMGMGMSMDVE